MEKLREAKGNKIGNLINIKHLFMISIIFILAMCSTVYAKYILIRNSTIKITTAPFYFDAEIDNSVVINNGEVSNLIVKNNDGTEYNSFSTTYEIRMEGNDDFTFSIDGENSVNNVITKTISGGSALNDSMKIEFAADASVVDSSESATLKVTAKSPYAKEISSSINLNLHKVTVTLNATGGAVNPSTITVYKGKTYADLPTPTWAGHVFNGWYSAESGGTKYEKTTQVTTTSSTQTLYAQWTSYLIADNVKVGDYVNYPVTYANVATTANSTHIAADSYTGWRVLSIEGTGDDAYVRLVSAGVPLTYVHSTAGTTPAATSITNLTTNFLSTAISSTSTNYRFRSCGFKNASGGSITTIAQLKTLFTNEYTQTTSAGVPKVQSMTKTDLDKVWGEVTANADSVKTNDLLAIPAKDQTSTPYATYFLATANGVYLWAVYWEGAVVYTYSERGVRPVVTLKPSVEITSKVDDVWQLK